ncbi:MAG TPA: TauD/TfdA family dioxygenase [Bryobacteraceae bacterium]|nr:TauD/TfdA family dioxygenase [Bryobacteraceae bacterium]
MLNTDAQEVSARAARQTVAAPAAQDPVRSESTFPAIIEPDSSGNDLVEWLRSAKDTIPELLRSGAVLFRGFSLRSASEFEAAARVVCPNLHGEYGDLPKEDGGNAVYRSTPYPPNRAILFHNESSHQSTWPLKQFFFCVQPAQSGGETPIVDCRLVLDRLPAAIRDRFRSSGLRYVRNFIPGFDVSWSQFFKTSDKTVVEERCGKEGASCKWRPDGGLQMTQECAAVLQHPQTGEDVFFNQIQLHHPFFLDDGLRTSLASLFAPGDEPRNVFYGDGETIDEHTTALLRDIYAELQVQFAWEAGDFLLLDNMLAAHGRNPYSGARKILVAMGEMATLRHGSVIASH